MLSLNSSSVSKSIFWYGKSENLRPRMVTYAWLKLRMYVCVCVCVCVCACARGRVCTQLLSHVRLFATPWTITCQAPLSMEFSRQEYWSGLPFPSPGDLPNPRIEPASLASPALASSFITSYLGSPWEYWIPNYLKLPGWQKLSPKLAEISFPFRGSYHDLLEEMLCSSPLFFSRSVPIIPCRLPGNSQSLSTASVGNYTLLQGKQSMCQSCPTLSDPMDCSPPGSSIHGIL